MVESLEGQGVVLAKNAPLYFQNLSIGPHRLLVFPLAVV